MSSDPSKASGSARQDVLAFLDDLDNLSSSVAPPPSTTPIPAQASSVKAPSSSNPADAQDVLNFFEEITSAPPRSQTPLSQLHSNVASTSSPSHLKQPSNLQRSDSSSNLKTGSGVQIGPPNRKSTDSAKSYRTSAEKEGSSPKPQTQEVPATSGGGWGWSSMWNSASAAIQQAQKVVEDKSGVNLSQISQQAQSQLQNQMSNLNVQNFKNVDLGNLGANIGGNVGSFGEVVKGFRNSEQAKKWMEGAKGMVKGVQLEQIGNDLRAIGGKTLHDILNAVAPPIAEHEVIQVSLSHDMVGYDGLESLVYRSFAKVMEQVQGGDLVVNKGHEAIQRRNPKEGDEDRNLNFVEGLTEGYKLSEVALNDLIQKTYKPPSDDDVSSSSSKITIPVTKCPVYMRIQPCLSEFPFWPSSAETETEISEFKKEKHLFFIMSLKDPNNKLSHTTLTQSLPGTWLDIPFEENEWVEDIMVEIIRRGVEVIGQQYINGRMSGRSTKNMGVTTAVKSEEEIQLDDEKMAEAIAASPVA